MIVSEEYYFPKKLTYNLNDNHKSGIRSIKRS